MATKSIVKAITLRGHDVATIDAWTLLFPGGLPHPCFLIRFANQSNVNVFVKYDTENNAHDIVRANNDLVLYLQTNSRESGLTANFAKGTPIYVRAQEQQGVGYIWFTAYYQI